jgi:hypothetical protein
VVGTPPSSRSDSPGLPLIWSKGLDPGSHRLQKVGRVGGGWGSNPRPTDYDRIMRLLALREDLRRVVRKALPRGRIAVEIADDLIAYPILTVADAQSRYGRTNQANRDAINALVNLGVLEPYGSATYDRLFWNRRVFQIADN